MGIGLWTWILKIVAFFLCPSECHNQGKLSHRLVIRFPPILFVTFQTMNDATEDFFPCLIWFLGSFHFLCGLDLWGDKGIESGSKVYGLSYAIMFSWSKLNIFIFKAHFIHRRRSKLFAILIATDEKKLNQVIKVIGFDDFEFDSEPLFCIELWMRFEIRLGGFSENITQVWGELKQ
jgi:hypothetical protein